MNGDMFKKWLREKLLLNLPEITGIEMDNESYLSVHSTRKKADIQKWMCDHKVPFENTVIGIS